MRKSDRPYVDVTEDDSVGQFLTPGAGNYLH